MLRADLVAQVLAGSRGRRPDPRSRGSRWPPRGSARRRRRTPTAARPRRRPRTRQCGPGWVHGDGDVPAEGDGLAALHQHGRLHLAGDDVGSLPSSASPRRRGSWRYCWRTSTYWSHVGATGAQQVRVGLVDDDLRAPAGELPQGVRAADVVDVAVGQQDPAHVLDAAAERLERGGHAFGGRRGDAGVDDGRLGRVDEEAVEPEAAPGRDQRMDGDWSVIVQPPVQEVSRLLEAR